MSGYYLCTIQDQWLPTDALYWGADSNGSYGVMFGNNWVGVSNTNSFMAPIQACNVRYIVNEPAATTTDILAQDAADRDSNAVTLNATNIATRQRVIKQDIAEQRNIEDTDQTFQVTE
jgi:hypothetical protein